MALSTQFIASAGFESARRLGAGPLHGHGFGVAVCCALPDAWAPFPGGEVEALVQALAAATAPLDRCLLNDRLPEPTDERLAQWLHAQAALPGLRQLRLHSSARQGVELDAAGRVQLWRRYRFQSAHRLPHVPLGHKCGLLHGHGFEAVVQVRQGEPGGAPLTHDTIDEHWAPLHAELNHACLNELPGLDNPTSEVLCRWLWQRLQPGLPGLAQVSVHETGSSGASHDGERFRIWKDFTLDSALRFKRAPQGHPLARVHGFTCLLRLHLSAPLHEVLGWAVDFGDVKERFTPIFQALDHQPLHERADLADCDSATLAAWVLQQARAQLPQIDRVELHQTPGCGASVGLDERSAALPA